MSEARNHTNTLGRWRGCGFLGLKIGLAGLLTLAILIPAGLVYQARAVQQDRQKYPPPGRLVDVGGFKLHLFCAGSGSPTVVLEAGLGDGAFIWGSVIDPVARQTRVCAYDRPGLGWSDFVDHPFDRDSVAQNLHRLLQNADIPAPYILVGHSIGGIYARAYTQRYPDEVAGLVFVDSAHENQSGRMSNRRNNAGRALDRMLALCAVIAPTGVFRLFGLGEALMEDTGLSDPLRRAAAATLNRSTYCRTIANEMNSSDLDTSQPDKPRPLGDTPLIVLVAGQEIGRPGFDATGQPTQAPGLEGSRWLRLQKELAGLSTHSRLVVAEKSDHYIHLEQPDLVVQAILEVVQSARSQQVRFYLRFK